MKTDLGEQIIKVSARFKRQIRCAKTGEIVKESPWESNLVLDQGLSGFAKNGTQSANTVAMLAYLHIGSDNTPNSISSGAVTFTQTGTTVTASGSFFTAGMVGQLFKYGTGSGGAEYYITGFTSATQVTVDTSATVAVPEVATVWAVNRTTLVSESFRTNTYQNNAGDNTTTYNTTSFTHQRTYINGVQGSPYTVNELGYGVTNTTAIAGRIVLSSSDVVGTSNFYVVILQVTFTVGPNVPTAVADVGTNINTAGNAMFESYFCTNNLASVGSSASWTMDQTNTSGSPFTRIFAALTNYSQRANPASASFSLGSQLDMGIAQWRAWLSGFTCRWTLSYSTTTAGQTCYGVGIGESNGNTTFFDVKFTTPVTLPTGTFQGTIEFRQTWGRTLTN